MGAAGENDFRSLLEAGAHHLESQQFVQALKAYTRAVEARPEDVSACIGKTATMRKLNRPRGALKVCVQGLLQQPDCEALQQAKGELLAELGEEGEDIVAEVLGLRKPPEDDDEEEDDDEVSPLADDGACPGAKSMAQRQKEGMSLKGRLSRSAELEAALKDMASPKSAEFRRARKQELQKFYCDFYAQTSALAGGSKLDTSQYSKEDKLGLSLKDGHRPMPRPEGVELPADHRAPVGVLSAAELAAFNSGGSRLLVSLHGDLFDVSDRPDKYGPTGPYHSMAGHDITWALWSGYDDEHEWDKYFDVMKCESREERDRRFQGLMSWWAFYEQEYGQPVGRLDVYEREWDLPRPPKVQDLCTVM